MIRERRDPIVLPAPEDIDAIAAAAPGNLARMMAQDTGMREDELSGLERVQVRQKNGEVDLRNSKTNRPSNVELDERASGTIYGTLPYLKLRRVFRHGKGQRYRGLVSRFAPSMRREVEVARVKRRFRFHDLRHWYAVDCLRRGGNIYDLQQILSHQSLKTTEIYLDYLTVEQQKRAEYGVSQNVAQG